MIRRARGCEEILLRSYEVLGDDAPRLLRDLDF